MFLFFLLLILAPAGGSNQTSFLTLWAPFLALRGKKLYQQEITTYHNNFTTQPFPSHGGGPKPAVITDWLYIAVLIIIGINNNNKWLLLLYRAQVIHQRLTFKIFSLS